ncbi:protein PML isoform X1 [Lepisosteus oculatus]|uniref:protein PML isoform X1 n=1 Tax=Lepisosteus oculatus TaxID=7918 RepID=UPI003710C7E1
MANQAGTLLHGEQFLLCGICTRNISSPKLLSCLHTFCEECLTRSEKSDSVTCPTCQKATELPKVKNNVLFSELKARVDTYRQIVQASVLPCSRCRAGASFLCFECEKMLCQSCFDAHQIFTEKEGHPVDSVENLRRMDFPDFLEATRKKRLPYCPSHEKQMISIFCRTCSKSVCCTCTILEHKPPAHEHCDMKEEVQLQKQDLKKMSAALLEKQEAFAKACQELWTLRDSNRAHKAELEDAIKEAVRETVQVVTEKGDALLGELEGMYANKDAEIKGQLCKTENVLKRVDAACDLIEKIECYGADKDVLEMQGMVRSSLQELQREDRVHVKPQALKVTFTKSHVESRACVGSLAVWKNSVERREMALSSEASGVVSVKRAREDDQETEWIDKHRNQSDSYHDLQPQPKRHTSPDLYQSEASMGSYPGTDSPRSTSQSPVQEIESMGTSQTDSWVISSSESEDESPSGAGGRNHNNQIVSQLQISSEIQSKVATQDWATGTIVFFDLETTGLDLSSNIIQLSAVCGELTFNTYILPVQPITQGASAVNGLTMEDGVLLLHSEPVETTSIGEALTAFLNFLRCLSEPLLVGHNIWRFDCPILIRVLKKVGLRDELENSVSGFLDTLPLAKDILKNVEIRNFSLQNLVKCILMESYLAHNALEDALVLQRLYNAMIPTPEQTRSHSFSLLQVETYDSLQPLIAEKALTKPAAQKLAKGEVSFDMLRKAYQQDPKNGLNIFLLPWRKELGLTMFAGTIKRLKTFFSNMEE